MSLSNEWFEFHLTPSGWVAGNEKLDVVGLKERPIPPDRVLTVRFTDFLSHAFARPKRSREVVWHDADKSKVKALELKFGADPSGFSGWARRR